MKSAQRTRWMDRIALLCLLLALGVVCFGAGVVAGGLQWRPYYMLRDARNTIRSHFQAPDQPLVDVMAEAPNPADLAGPRVEASGDGDDFLVFGGLNMFRDYCPDFGCVAVLFDRQGQMKEAWPFRPAEIWEANRTPEFVYEAPRFDPVIGLRVLGVKRLADGDLIVSFNRGNLPMFPFGAGIARLAPDGTPRWYRRDYTHHWPNLTPDGQVLATAAEVGRSRISVAAGPYWPATQLDCPTPYRDMIRVLSDDGQVLKEISVIDSLLASDARAMISTESPCDPLHLNFVDVLRPSAAGAIDGARPGDFVVSLRNLDAFAILDQDDGRLKRIFYGRFRRQHSVHHLDGSKFLLFDNRGDREIRTGARLVEFDAATGEERVIFPTGPARGVHSHFLGHLSISSDRKRAIASFSLSGMAYEVDIETGQVRGVIRNNHDVAGVAGLESGAVNGRRMFWLTGVDLIAPATTPPR